jgi:hypothetical protein
MLSWSCVAGPVSLSWLPSSPLSSSPPSSSSESSSSSPEASSSSDSWLDCGALACSTGWVLGGSLLEPGVLVPLGALEKRPLLSLCGCEMAAIENARLGMQEVAECLVYRDSGAMGCSRASKVAGTRLEVPVLQGGSRGRRVISPMPENQRGVLSQSSKM